MGQAENRFFGLLADLRIGVEKPFFPWLTTQILPGSSGTNDVLWEIFLSLGGSPEGMRSKNARKLSPDGYIKKMNCLIEFDELQHFTKYRRNTLEFYPSDAPLGFNLDLYKNWCDKYAATAFKKGPAGYRKAKKEFPFEGGRAAQRALFDACRDLMPMAHGLAPTIRISEMQVPSLMTNLKDAQREVSEAFSEIGLR